MLKRTEVNKKGLKLMIAVGFLDLLAAAYMGHGTDACSDNSGYLIPGIILLLFIVFAVLIFRLPLGRSTKGKALFYVLKTLFLLIFIAGLWLLSFTICF
jgi:hypothetical protein